MTETPDKPKRHKGRIRSFHFYPADEAAIAEIKQSLGLNTDVDAIRHALRHLVESVKRTKRK